MTAIRLRTFVGKAMLLLAVLPVCVPWHAPALADVRKTAPKVVRQVNSADGVRIVYDVQGTGPVALVFVHGWLSDRSDWDAVAGLLAARYTVVTLDLASHGASGRRKVGQLDVKSFGQDVEAVAKASGLRRMILIGHNLGGDAIVEAAMLLRGQVAGLVWVDSYRNLALLPTSVQIEDFLHELACFHADTTKAFARRMFSDGAHHEMVERVASRMAATPPEIAIPTVGDGLLYGPKVPLRLKELNLKVIAFTPESATDDEVKLMRRVYGVDLQLLKGPRERSFIMLEDPKRFISLLGEAIGKILR